MATYGGGFGKPGGAKETFDGKQLRKAVQRRTVDYNSSAMRWFLDRTWKNDIRETPLPEPVYEATLDLVPPAAPSMDSRPVTSVCTKFVHSSVNKPRCPINACRWTPEGKRLITGASTGEFTLWNGLTFNFETILQAHDSAVRSMVWSHNEYWMVTGDHKGLIKYWRSNMNNLKAFTAHEESIRDISFANSDLKFASCSDDGAIKVWDFALVEQERALKGHGWDVRCIDWHPQLPIIASGSKDSLVKIWDAKSGQNLTTLHGHKSTIAKVKWNKNGNWLLTGSRDQLIKVFDIRTMRDFQTFRGHTREVNSMQWHPVHEDLFVSGAWDGAICYWLLGQDSPIASVATAHQSSVWDLDWHPLGHILVSASNDHTTKFWTRNRPGDTMSDRHALDGKDAEPEQATVATQRRRPNDAAQQPSAKRPMLGEQNEDGKMQKKWGPRNVPNGIAGNGAFRGNPPPMPIGQPEGISPVGPGISVSGGPANSQNGPPVGPDGQGMRAGPPGTAPPQGGAPHRGDLPRGVGPPGSMMGPAGRMPPGIMPPGAMPPGTMPPGTMPPGMMPPGTMPPGAWPPGTGPPGTGPPGTGPSRMGPTGTGPPGGMPGGPMPPGFMPPLPPGTASADMSMQAGSERRGEHQQGRGQPFYPGMNPEQKSKMGFDMGQGRNEPPHGMGGPQRGTNNMDRGMPMQGAPGIQGNMNTYPPPMPPPPPGVQSVVAVNGHANGAPGSQGSDGKFSRGPDDYSGRQPERRSRWEGR